MSRPVLVWCNDIFSANGDDMLALLLALSSHSRGEIKLTCILTHFFSDARAWGVRHIIRELRLPNTEDVEIYYDPTQARLHFFAHITHFVRLQLLLREMVSSIEKEGEQGKRKMRERFLAENPCWPEAKFGQISALFPANLKEAVEKKQWPENVTKKWCPHFMTAFLPPFFDREERISPVDARFWHHLHARTATAFATDPSEDVRKTGRISAVPAQEALSQIIWRESKLQYDEDPKAPYQKNITLALLAPSQFGASLNVEIYRQLRAVFSMGGGFKPVGATGEGHLSDANRIGYNWALNGGATGRFLKLVEEARVPHTVLTSQLFTDGYSYPVAALCNPVPYEVSATVKITAVLNKQDILHWLEGLDMKPRIVSQLLRHIKDCCTDEAVVKQVAAGVIVKRPPSICDTCTCAAAILDAVLSVQKEAPPIMTTQGCQFAISDVGQSYAQDYMTAGYAPLLYQASKTSCTRIVTSFRYNLMNAVVNLMCNLLLVNVKLVREAHRILVDIQPYAVSRTSLLSQVKQALEHLVKVEPNTRIDYTTQLLREVQADLSCIPASLRARLVLPTILSSASPEALAKGGGTIQLDAEFATVDTLLNMPSFVHDDDSPDAPSPFASAKVRPTAFPDCFRDPRVLLPATMRAGHHLGLPSSIIPTGIRRAVSP